MDPDFSQLTQLIAYVRARIGCSHAEAVLMATDLDTKGLRLGMIAAGSITRKDLAEIGLLKPLEASALAPLGAEAEANAEANADDPVEAAAVAAPGPGAEPAANAEANAEETEGGSYCPTSPPYDPASYQQPKQPKRRRSEPEHD